MTVKKIDNQGFQLYSSSNDLACALGFHKYDPSKTGRSTFLDVADAQYDLRNPNRIIFGFNPSEKPGAYGVGEFNKGKIGNYAILPYPWDSALEFYIDYERDRVIIPSGENILEVRDLSDLSRLIRKIRLPFTGATGVALDSQDRVWIISSVFRNGNGNVYVLDSLSRNSKVTKVANCKGPTSIDSMRISPWGKKIFVVDHLLHRTIIFDEEGERIGKIISPYPSGIKSLVDERAMISSGKIPNHVDLLFMIGGLHVVDTNWFAYVYDFATQASNRADGITFDKVLIQWYLGFQEIKTPLKKDIPYVVPLGRANKEDKNLVYQEEYHSFTPIFVGSHADVFASDKNTEITVEMAVPRTGLLSYNHKEDWIVYDRSKGMVKISTSGLFRCKSVGRSEAYLWANCHN